VCDGPRARCCGDPAGLPLRALERGVLVNVTAGRVMRFFPPLNIPEDDLWPAVETLLELVVQD
jgi:acetylornithine/succinyldiaminopimelate/putrescine aminotransferase